MARIRLVFGIAGMLFLLLAVAPSRSESQQHSFTPEPIIVEGVPNFFRVSPTVYSGGNPKGNAGFDALRRLGIRTLITVDGAEPEIATAHQFGMRYVHLPIGYDGIPRATALKLAKAVQSLPGPVYIHCHHGQHRGPAAVACVLLSLDPVFTPADAHHWLALAGTDPRYTALVQFPDRFQRPTKEELAGVPDIFSEITPPSNLVQMMIAIDGRWDRVKAWHTRAGAGNVPVEDAVQLAELFRELARHPHAKKVGGNFSELAHEAEAASAELELSLRNARQESAGKAYERLRAGCTRCHAEHRN